MNMDQARILQIPPSVEDCIYLMRSYIYIDKYNGEVYIREISPFLAPGFILGVCAQIPFLYQFVKPYIKDANRGEIQEVFVSNQHKQEMELNQYVNSQLIYHQYTPSDCDFVLSVLLNAIIQSVFGRFNANFRQMVEESVQRISEISSIFPMNFQFPRTFRHIMKTTLVAVPELRIRMMSLLCQNNYFKKATIWSLVKRYIWIQVRNFHMGTFISIGQWYEAREKTLAHVDSEVVEEMKKYLAVVAEMEAIAQQQGYNLGTFRILNPKSMLPYLRQFPCSAYCAIEWKKKIDNRWKNYQYDLHRFGVDTESLDRMMAVPVKYTLKRRLNDDEIETISQKRFKVLETEYTHDPNIQIDDDDGIEDGDFSGDENGDGNGDLNEDQKGNQSDGDNVDYTADFSDDFNDQIYQNQNGNNEAKNNSEVEYIPTNPKMF